MWCGLERTRLFELDLAWVHDPESRMLAHRRLRGPDDGPSSVAVAFVGGSAGTVPVVPGASLVWDGVPWTVLDRGEDTVTFRREDESRRVVSLSVSDVESLLQDDALRGADAASDLVAARDAVFHRATAGHLDRALLRWEAVHVLQDPRASAPPGVPARSCRRILRWARDGERRYGSAFAGVVRFRGRPPGAPAPYLCTPRLLHGLAIARGDDRYPMRLASFATTDLLVLDDFGLTKPSSGNCRD